MNKLPIFIIDFVRTESGSVSIEAKTKDEAVDLFQSNKYDKRQEVLNRETLIDSVKRERG